MARPSIENITIDMSNRMLNAQLRTRIAAMEGIYEFSAKPRRATRSTRANAYYFAAVVRPFFEFLSEQEPCITEPIQAHTELKRQVLGTVAVKAGNTVSRIVRTTHDMDTATFLDYVERARVFLREQVGIETLDPGEYGVESPVESSKDGAAV